LQTVFNKLTRIILSQISKKGGDSREYPGEKVSIGVDRGIKLEGRGKS